LWNGIEFQDFWKKTIWNCATLECLGGEGNQRRTRAAKVREVLFVEKRKKRPHGGSAGSPGGLLSQAGHWVVQLFLLPECGDFGINGCLLERCLSGMNRCFLGRSGVFFPLANCHLLGKQGTPTVCLSRWVAFSLVMAPTCLVFYCTLAIWGAWKEMKMIVFRLTLNENLALENAILITNYCSVHCVWMQKVTEQA
jgi:hypothetical protein